MSWRNEYQIPAGEVDAVLAQLMLLHMCMQCVVDLKFFEDEAMEEKSHSYACHDDVVTNFNSMKCVPGMLVGE